MELMHAIKTIDTSEKQLRYFGYLFCGILAIVGFFFIRSHGTASLLHFIIAGLVLFGITTFSPKLLKFFYVVWMSVSLVIGMVVSTVLLTVLFIIGIYLTSLVAKACGKKFLELKKKKGATTYWITRNYPIEKIRYEKQ